MQAAKVVAVVFTSRMQVAVEKPRRCRPGPVKVVRHRPRAARNARALVDLLLPGFQAIPRRSAFAFHQGPRGRPGWAVPSRWLA
jgi:hypothetical protein